MNLTHLSLTRVRPAEPVPAPLSNQDRLRAFRHALIEMTEPAIGNVRLWMLLRRREAELQRIANLARSVA